jgi:hypothetical protein
MLQTEQARREAYALEKEVVRQAILPYSFDELAYDHRELWQKARAFGLIRGGF